MRTRPAFLVLVLLGAPLACHGQLFVVAGSLTGSGSASQNTGFPDSFSFSDHAPTAYMPGNPVVGFPGGSRTAYSAESSGGVSFQYDVGPDIAGFSLTSAAQATAHGGGSATTSSQAALSCSFQVTTTVLATFNFGLQNSGPLHLGDSNGQVDGASELSVTLSSAGGGTLAHFGNSANLPLTFASLNLGTLLPGETYTLTAWTSAEVTAHSLSGTRTGGRVADFSATLVTNAVPEPADFATVAGLGLLAVAASRRRARVA